MIYTIPADETPHSSIADKTANKANIAYPCSGFQCQKPLENTDEFETYLRNNSYSIQE